MDLTATSLGLTSSSVQTVGIVGRGEYFRKQMLGLYWLICPPINSLGLHRRLCTCIEINIVTITQTQIQKGCEAQLVIADSYL